MCPSCPENALVKILGIKFFCGLINPTFFKLTNKKFDSNKLDKEMIIEKNNWIFFIRSVSGRKDIRISELSPTNKWPGF